MSKIRIANAPCSWGSLEFEGMEGKAIGYQQMLDELAETGYDGTELGDWGYMPTEPADLSAELSRRKLALLGAFVPVGLKDRANHKAGRIAALKVANLMSAVAGTNGQTHRPFLVLADDNGNDAARTQHAGSVTSAMQLSDAEWDSFAAGADDIAHAVKEQTGLSTVFHHHCAGYVETPTEIARLMEMTDPQLLGMVFDTGHFMYGSGSNDADLALGWMERFADRIWYVHLKDCHPEVASAARDKGWDYFEALRHGVFCELGQGCVDFPRVVQWLGDHDYDGWAVVEQDVLPGMGAPRESAQRNRDYLRSIGV